MSTRRRVWSHGRRENAKSSGLEAAPIRWIVDDCAKFVERELRRGRCYDAIIMDPPQLWTRAVRRDLEAGGKPLAVRVRWSRRCFPDEPLFVIINSYTTGLAPSVLGYIMDSILTKKIRRPYRMRGELGLPVRDTGLVLPCGSTGRWTKGKDNEFEANQVCDTALYRYQGRMKTEQHVVFNGLDLSHCGGKLCRRSGPQRLRQVHAGKAYERDPPARRAAA